MLIKVEVRNPAGTLLTLMLDDDSSGYIVEGIEGLDPVKATLVSSSFANLDGSQFQSARRENRNIIVKIDLRPDFVTQTVRGLRQALYSFFMTKSEVSLRFYDSDGTIVNIMGRVESCETALFSQEPRVDVSIMCFDPDFLEMDSIVVSGSTVSTTTEFDINYDGTVESGILFELNLNRSLSDFTIYHRAPDGIIRQLNFSAALLSGDKLTISTVTGNKYINLLRSGTTSSLLYGMPPQSAWIELQPGLNHLRVYAVGAAIPFTITYAVRHGGL